ncbi:ATP-binding protein [Nocardiopsis chromatogenes]|uniref:ATP-binding protein n=1 Tax=Nocardiopsis chromatogenes TaxID=280239 RepID=UPI0023AA20D2|nr:hypothetical protein [Nocardiopsis chromatogenes]
MRALGVHALAERLDDRFRLLTGGRRGTPERQRTLRATIDWSWETLGADERLVLRRLAAHADGCGLAAAEAVCSGDGVAAEDVVDTLGRLVARSLVIMVDGAEGPRYWLLESVAAYCAERLEEAGEAAALAGRHADHYTAFAERAAPYLYGPQQRTWLRRLDAESANLRTALDTAVRGGDAARAERLVAALTWYWCLRGRLREAQRSLAAALALDGAGRGGTRADLQVWAAGIGVLTRTGPDPVGQARRALSSGRGAGPLERARARWFLATALFAVNKNGLGAELIEEALIDFRAHGDRWGTAAALAQRTWYGLFAGDLAGAARDGEQSLEYFRELGDQWGLVQAGDALATLAEITGDYGRAERLHREGLRIAEGLGLWHDASWKYSGIGRIALLNGDYRAAREFHERGVRTAEEHSDHFGRRYAELGLGLVARREGDLDAAEAHLLRLRDWIGGRGGDSTLALILAELGFVAELRGDPEEALRLQTEGYAAAGASGEPRAVALALEGLAGAKALAGEHTEAARLLGAAAAVREGIGAPLPAAERRDVDRVAGAVRAALGEAGFAAEARAGAQTGPEGLVGPGARGR